MFLIILSGILTCGVIPIVSLFGYSIELVLSLFKVIPEWGYWQNFAIGLLFLTTIGTIFKFTIPIKFKGLDKLKGMKIVQDGKEIGHLE
jgi:hypothetical protein